MRRIVNLIENYSDEPLRSKLLKYVEAHRENFNSFDSEKALSIFNISDVDDLKSFRAHEIVYDNLNLRIILSNIIGILYNNN